MIGTDRPLSRLVLLGALAAALAMAGCGRKGPLDAPPGGSAAIANQPGDQPAQQTSQGGNLINRTNDTTLPRVQGQDRRIPLDVLLN